MAKLLKSRGRVRVRVGRVRVRAVYKRTFTARTRRAHGALEDPQRRNRVTNCVRNQRTVFSITPNCRFTCVAVAPALGWSIAPHAYHLKTPFYI